MNQTNQITRITPALEHFNDWSDLPLATKNKDKSQLLLFGMLRLIILTSLIFGALAAGAATSF